MYPTSRRAQLDYVPNKVTQRRGNLATLKPDLMDVLWDHVVTQLLQVVV
jgi:hypothetical protein